MPLDGHSYLVSQGWSGHGTGLRQDSIIRPLAIPQKRTLAGLGKDRDEAFPFWDHVFSIAAKSIQVKLYKDDEDDSDTEDTPIQSSLELTTTGIISNKPPKLGLSATATATATTTSSSSNSGINTPAITTSIIPHSLASSSSNLLVAAKKESAKRILYSRFFRGPVLGPDSDSPTSSDSDAILKTRTGDETSGWNSNLNGGVKSGSRTPMAIAKSKLTTASEVVVPLRKGIEKLKGEEEQKKVKKRKRSDDDEAKIKEQEGEGEGEERRKKEKKEKKKKEREEKKEKKEKKRRKRDEKESLKGEEKRERKSKKDKIVELNENSTNLDKSKLISSCEDEELRNDHSEKKRKKRKEKDGRPDITGDKEKRRRERKQNRDRKDAEKKVAATAVVSQVIGADCERLDDSDTRLVCFPVENSENLRSESKKKKKRKRDD